MLNARQQRCLVKLNQVIASQAARNVPALRAATRIAQSGCTIPILTEQCAVITKHCDAIGRFVVYLMPGSVK